MFPLRRASRLLPAVLVFLAALFTVTATLAAWYHAERAARARQHVSAGHAYAARGERVLAVGEYRAALLLERDNAEAERALALALLELGRLSEAESYFSGLLEREPVSGPLNLGMARVRAARGADAEARRLYQRAIYGEWPEGDSGGRMTARFELAEGLLLRGRLEEVIAELLRLKAEVSSPDNTRERRLAGLFLQAGAPDLAADVLAAMAERQPRDVDLLAQLAEAQTQAGRAAEARRTLRQLLAVDPGRDDVRARLTVVDRLLALDPTLPNLRITTRARRARELLQAVIAGTAECRELPADAAEARRDAETRVRSRAALTPDAAEVDLTASVLLWTAAAACRGGGPEAEAVSRVVERVQLTREDPQP